MILTSLLKLNEKDDKSFYAMWCDTCNRMKCETRKLYKSKWEIRRRF